VLGTVMIQVLPATASRDVASATIEVEGHVEGGVTSAGRMHQVRLHGTLPGAGSTAGTRTLLFASSARIVMADGRDEDVMIADQHGRAAMRTQALGRRAPEELPLAVLSLTAAQLQALQAGTATLMLEGTAAVQRSSELAMLDMTDAAVHTARGIRVRIDQEGTVQGDRVRAVVSGATVKDSPATRGGDDLEFTLVGTAPGDTLRLEQRQGGGSTGILVLPSRRAWHRDELLFPPLAPQGAPQPGWPAGARLRVSVWQPVEQYRVRVTATRVHGDGVLRASVPDGES
jgi:hypothetical protein